MMCQRVTENEGDDETLVDLNDGSQQSLTQLSS